MTRRTALDRGAEWTRWTVPTMRVESLQGSYPTLRSEREERAENEGHAVPQPRPHGVVVAFLLPAGQFWTAAAQ